MEKRFEREPINYYSRIENNLPEKRLAVPLDNRYNICKMNEELKSTNNAIDFVVCVSEEIAAYNERMISYDMDKVMDEAYANEYIDMKKEDLGSELDILEEEFSETDAGCFNWECVAIRKWIEQKSA